MITVEFFSDMAWLPEKILEMTDVGLSDDFKIVINFADKVINSICGELPSKVSGKKTEILEYRFLYFLKGGFFCLDIKMMDACGNSIPFKYDDEEDY